METEKSGTLWELTAGWRLRYGLAIASMALSNVFLFGVPLVTKGVIDRVLPSPEVGAPSPTAASGGTVAGGRGPGDTETVWMLVGAAIAVVALTVVAGAFLYLRGYLASTASEGIVRRVRNRLFEHLEHLPTDYIDRTDTGDLVQRCTSDVETLRIFLTAQIVEIGRAVLLLLTVIPVMLWIDVRMTLISLAIFPVIILFAVLFFRRVKSVFLETDEAEGKMTAVLQENLTGIRVVRAFARQDFERDKFGASNARFRDCNYRLIQLLGRYWALSDVLCLGQIGLVLVVGAWWVTRGELSVGSLFAFWSYELIVIWPVRHLGRVLTDTGKAVVALGRLGEVLGVQREAATDVTENRPRELAGGVQFERVTFAYRGSHVDEDGEDSVILGDLSFEIRPGETVALIGPPGSGKSTVVHLLLRLYDCERGSIRLDGHDVRSLSRSFVRSQIAVVLQEPFLYSKTIGTNIRVGRGEASDEDLVAAANAACIHASVENFEHGYDTLVGERGVTLSGGQIQRVALARALVKDSPILILDDALSAVDVTTEAQITRMLNARRHRRTTLIIAHRLSSVASADRVLVLEEGRITQAGTHEELLGQEGLYRRLWGIQQAFEKELEGDLARSRPGAETAKAVVRRQPGERG